MIFAAYLRKLLFGLNPEICIALVLSYFLLDFNSSNLFLDNYKL